MKRRMILFALAAAMLGILALMGSSAAPINAATPTEVPLLYHDGRVNPYDALESVTAYCVNYGDVQVWAVKNSQGYYAFTATKAQLNAQTLTPAQPTLINQNLGVSLWRLPSGQLQINGPAYDGKSSQYSAVFTGC